MGLTLADTGWILFALGVPVLAGALLVMAVWPSRAPGYWACMLGMAFPLGMVQVVAGYLVLGHFGGELHFELNVLIQLLVAAVAGAVALFRWHRLTPSSGGGDCREDWQALPRIAKVFLSALIVWMLLRFSGILIEVLHRPLFPWDAWFSYGLQAKIWFFHPHFDIFADHLGWFEAEMPTWTVGGRHHPPGIGLIQLWTLQALGRWDDALMNLAWPVALASLAFMLFGWLRIAGGGLGLALLVAASVFTLPVINTHAVLAGYGDLWVAILFLISAGSMWVARFQNRPSLTLLAVVAAAGMLMIKETSLMWMPVLALGALVGWARIRWIILCVLISPVIFLALLWLHGEPVRISTLGRIGFSGNGFVWPWRIGLEYWHDIVMWPALLRHLLVIENWHLFWYLAPILVLAGMWLSPSQRDLAMLVVMGITGFVLLYVLFAFTGLGNTVIEGTSVNRLLLHLAPLIGFLCGLVVIRWRAGLVVGKEAGALG